MIQNLRAPGVVSLSYRQNLTTGWRALTGIEQRVWHAAVWLRNHLPVFLMVQRAQRLHILTLSSECWVRLHLTPLLHEVAQTDYFHAFLPILPLTYLCLHEEPGDIDTYLHNFLNIWSGSRCAASALGMLYGCCNSRAGRLRLAGISQQQQQQRKENMTTKLSRNQCYCRQIGSAPRLPF